MTSADLTMEQMTLSSSSMLAEMILILEHKNICAILEDGASFKEILLTFRHQVSAYNMVILQYETVFQCNMQKVFDTIWPHVENQGCLIFCYPVDIDDNALRLAEVFIKCAKTYNASLTNFLTGLKMRNGEKRYFAVLIALKETNTMDNSIYQKNQQYILEKYHQQLGTLLFDEQEKDNNIVNVMVFFQYENV